MSGFFVIDASEDGEVTVTCYSKDELEKALASHVWGENPEFITEISKWSDPSNWGGGRLMIFRGPPVAPVAVTTVTEFKIER